ncbi:hypothetical protein THAOC_32348, partial [Thalassiosira oceanica]
SHLVAKFESMDVQTQGLDRRPKLIAEINGIARSLGDEYDGLNFIEGTIGETNVQFLDGNVLPGTSEGALKIVICLHACDTATDDALWFAICHNADLIITAPCCQHELRPQIDVHARENPNHRFTEMTTDALRATLLEIAGYESTNVFEFIGSGGTRESQAGFLVAVTITDIFYPCIACRTYREEQHDNSDKSQELSQQEATARMATREAIETY